MKNKSGWIKKFETEFLKKPGEHLIEVGITGSGKTQGLYWVLDGLIHNNPGETIVWFDTGKSGEILTLARFKPLTVFIPYGTELKITAKDTDIEVKDFTDLKSIWCDLKKDRINVISIEPYILNPGTYTKVFTSLFSELIKLAHDYEIETPLAIFVDEFNKIAPARGSTQDEFQSQMGAVIQMNMERLRSLGVRFVCATHGWTKIKSGVRTSFNWIFPRRGAHFTADQPKLQRFNPLFETLDTGVGILVYPTKLFTDPMGLPYYKEGKELGQVRYLGVFENKNRSKQEKQGGPEKQDEPYKQKTPWDVLGVNYGASWDEVKAAYYSKALKYHPDKIANLAPEFIKLAEELMKGINIAYEELKKIYAI